MKIIGSIDGGLINADTIVRIYSQIAKETEESRVMVETLSPTCETYLVGHYTGGAECRVYPIRAKMLLEEFLTNGKLDGVLHIENNHNLADEWKRRETRMMGMLKKCE